MTTSGVTRASSCVWRWCSRLVRWVGRGGANVAALLYPPFCLSCQGSADWGHVLCARCAATLPRISGPVCAVCGDPLSLASLDLCLRCGTRRRAFDLAVSLGPYDGGWRTLLQAFKFRREKAVGRWLSAELARRVRDAGLRVDWVTYVPMTGAEERERGFNPSRFLARAAARRLGLPERRLLAKRRTTPPQRTLSARERETNLSDAFRAVRSGRGTVLLVDDLLTTGATADECARTLKRAGFDRVAVLTVARA